jgi:hypothetical protein
MKLQCTIAVSKLVGGSSDIHNSFSLLNKDNNNTNNNTSNNKDNNNNSAGAGKSFLGNSNLDLNNKNGKLSSFEILQASLQVVSKRAKDKYSKEGGLG